LQSGNQTNQTLHVAPKFSNLLLLHTIATNTGNQETSGGSNEGKKKGGHLFELQPEQIIKKLNYYKIMKQGKE